MANQYIFLKCECGEKIMLAKRMNTGFYVSSGKEKYFDTINDFFNKHEFCLDKRLDTFDISYESERE